MNHYTLQVMATDRYHALLREADQARTSRQVRAVPSAPPAVPSAPPTLGLSLLALARRVLVAHRRTPAATRHHAA
jgi:hypothetical protein